MAALKNIILDLGGVLLNIDYTKTEKAFQALGFAQFNQRYTQYSADKVFAELETGAISNDAFYEYMILAADGKISREQVAQAWNAMLLDFRVETLEFLKVLKKHYNLYLLSNTNAIHLQAFRKIFTHQTGLASLDNYFKTTYYSHEVGLRKPNKDIFEFVLKDTGVLAEESLFIDDSFNNINTAQEMGFKTHLLLPGEKIEDLNYDR
jgi:putative hydrolase of the HAD superfamily